MKIALYFAILAHMNSEILDKSLLQKVMCMGFSGFLTRGIGCVVLKEPAKINYSTITKEMLNYIPYANKDIFPLEAKGMMEYDPKKECILVIVDKQGKVLAVQLTAQQTGTTPVEAYRSWSFKNGMGKYVPGEVLYLKNPIDDLKSGHYIFLGRQGAMMKLCDACLDGDEGDIIANRNEHKIHCDFEDEFKVMLGIVVDLKDYPSSLIG